MDIALRIITAMAVIAFLTLYLYDVGAHRVYDIIISAAVIAATSPLFAALCIVSKIKCGKVFAVTDGRLVFTAPDNALKDLPWFLQVFVGTYVIMPQRLFAGKHTNN